MDKLLNFDNGVYGYRDYGGSDSKISIFLDGIYYMVKKPEVVVNRTNLETSYINSVFSEYISSHIFESLGIEVHKTVLGIYQDEYVVGCVDFCPPGYKNYEFATFMREVYRPIEIGRIPTYKQLHEIFELNDRLAPLKEDSIKRYWETLVADALVGNFDRHKGNWGYLVNADTHDIKLSPVYDCGASLYPKLAEHQMLNILNNPDEVRLRIEMFPAPALLKNDDLKNEEKFSCYELLSGDFYDQNCISAFERIYRRIDLTKINDIVDDTPLISEDRKTFYKGMIEKRKELLIDKAYEQCLLRGYIKNEEFDY